jgi:hypothetical protein
VQSFTGSSHGWEAGIGLPKVCPLLFWRLWSLFLHSVPYISCIPIFFYTPLKTSNLEPRIVTPSCKIMIQKITRVQPITANDAWRILNLG